MRIIYIVAMLSIPLFGCSLLDLPAIQDALAPEPSIASHVFDGMGNRRIRVDYFTSPGFIGGAVVYPGYLFYEEVMCIRLDERYLWEPGDTAQSMSDHYSSKENYRISLDEIADIPPDKVFYESQLIEIMESRDGEDISYSRSSFCIDTSDLEVGPHRAGIRLISPSGRIYAYAWTFEILAE